MNLFDEIEDDPGKDPRDPDWCDECQGEGEVVTADYEADLGDYKPCPKCKGEPPDMI